MVRRTGFPAFVIALVVVFLNIGQLSSAQELLNERQNSITKLVKLLEENEIHRGRSNGDRITCRNEVGAPVDWFVAYKLPELRHSVNPLVQEGVAHVVLLPGWKKWRMSGVGVNSTKSVVGLSTQPIFEPTQRDLLYLSYNDQGPDNHTKEDGAHAKGLIIANKKGGIWLQHSVPHFLDTDSSAFSYPHQGRRMGQVLFCMTLTPKQIDGTVARVLGIIEPHIFDRSIPSAFKKLYPNLKKALVVGVPNREMGRPSYPYSKFQNRTSRTFQMRVGELELTIFAKNQHNDKELYSDWIAPTLETNLQVQSWLNGQHPLNCSLQHYSVENIGEKRIEGDEFSTHVDHSKWAVGDRDSSSGDEWICIADMNRMEKQRHRGGAALCTKSHTLWSNFQETIQDILPCGKKIPPVM